MEDIFFATIYGTDTIPDIDVFYPTIDKFSSDPIFPDDYETAMKTGRFNPIPIMTGTILYDGMHFLGPADYGSTWEEYGPIDLMLVSSYNASEVTQEEILVANLAKTYYTGKSGLLNETLVGWVEMIGDGKLLSPDQKVAEYASQYVPVYNFR